MKTVIATSAAIVAAALAASAASSAPAPKSYWTSRQANAAVIAQASIPYCAIMQCVAGKPSIAGKVLDGQTANPFRVTSASCIGVAGIGATGPTRSAQFRCDFSTANDIVHGTLMVYTASPTTIRWKRLIASP